MPDRQEPNPEDDDIVASVKDRMRRAKQKREGTEAEDEEPELTDEEIDAIAREKEQVAQLLDRGIINNQLDPRKHLGDDFDEEMEYEWIRDNDADIDRAKALGFEVVTRPAEDEDPETPTPDQTKVRYGDVILMAIPRRRYEIIREVKEEKKKKRQDLGKREYLRRAQESEVGTLNPEGIEP